MTTTMTTTMTFDIVVSLTLMSFVSSTHFHGAHFWFQPAQDWTSDQPVVEVNFRLYWQLDYSATTRCNRETIASGQLIGPETPGYLECVDGCTSTSRVSDVSIRCTAYSVLGNWMYGVRNHSYTLPASAADVVTFEWAGTGWLVNDGQWLLRMTVNTTRRADTGQMNHSPRVLLPQLPYVIQLGCSMSLQLNVVDDDGDVVRCRWAEDSRQECGDVCQSRSSVDVTLNQTSCTVNYGTQTRQNVYVIAIQVEDFVHGQTTTALSSVPLQVSVAVLGRTSAACDERPVIVNPSDGEQCLSYVNQTASSIHVYGLRVLARSKDVYTRIPDISVSTTSDDVILTSSDVADLSESGVVLFYIDVNISSKHDVITDVINAPLCFIATDDFGRSSDVRCINASVGQNLIPQAERLAYSAATSRVTIFFDQLVNRGTRASLVRMYEVSTSDGQSSSSSAAAAAAAAEYNAANVDQVTVTANYISFQLPHSISTSSAVYSVLLETGVVTSALTCGINSAAVADHSLLTFNISASDGDDDEEDERSDEAWIYRWLIAALCLLAVVVIVILVVVVMATRHRRRARGRRFDNDVEMKRRQEKYFNTLRTTNDGYYNWTYDPTDVYST